VITVLLLTGPSIIAITEAALAGGPLPADLAGLLVRVLEPISRVALVLAAVGGLVEIIRAVIRIFSRSNR
jgi:hypothetical protein